MPLFLGQALARGGKAFEEHHDREQSRDIKQQQIFKAIEDVKQAQHKTVQTSLEANAQAEYIQQQQYINTAKATAKDATNLYLDHLSEGNIATGITEYNKAIQANPILLDTVGTVDALNPITDKNMVRKYLTDNGVDTEVITDTLIDDITQSGAFLKNNKGEFVDVNNYLVETGLLNTLHKDNRQLLSDRLQALRGTLTPPNRRPTTFEEYDRYFNTYQALLRIPEESRLSQDKDRIEFLEGVLKKKKDTTKAINEQADKEAIAAKDTFIEEWKVGSSKTNTRASAEVEQEFRLTSAMTPQLQKKEIEMRSMDPMVMNLQRVKNEMIDAVKDDKFSSGPVDTAIQWLGERTTEDMKEIVGMDTEAIMTRLGLESALGRALAERLKFYSGTAVADAEFQRTERFMMGLKTMQEAERIKAVSQFVAEEELSFKDQVRTLGESGLPYTADILYNKVMMNQDVSTTEARITQPGISKKNVSLTTQEVAPTDIDNKETGRKKASDLWK
jgi:hypothetical protein